MTNGNHHWIWENELPIDDLLGFVYVITNRSTGQRYYGRKQFWDKKVRYKRTKAGKRRREHYHTESNWRDYCGSSESLSADIIRFGEGSFEYRILAVFERKSGISLGEATAIVCSGAIGDQLRHYNRSAPSIRGKIVLTDFDSGQIEKLREWLHANRYE